jgi:hypothetical protein
MHYYKGERGSRTAHKLWHALREIDAYLRSQSVQQMRWTRRGANLLLQVRCAVYNGTFGNGLCHRFSAARAP